MRALLAAPPRRYYPVLAPGWNAASQLRRLCLILALDKSPGCTSIRYSAPRNWARRGALAKGWFGVRDWSASVVVARILLNGAACTRIAYSSPRQLNQRRPSNSRRTAPRRHLRQDVARRPNFGEFRRMVRLQFGQSRPATACTNRSAGIVALVQSHAFFELSFVEMQVPVSLPICLCGITFGLREGEAFLPIWQERDGMDCRCGAIIAYTCDEFCFSVVSLGGVRCVV